jgi:hypothetical protein
MWATDFQLVKPDRIQGDFLWRAARSRADWNMTDRGDVGAPHPWGESLMSGWPQTVSLIASTVVLFVAGYVVLQRQEVRA